MNPCFDYQFKVVLIGDSMVGKSSVVTAFNKGQFAQTSEPTIGVDFSARTICLPQNVRIKLQLWDTAGQEKFRSISRNYYRSAVAAIILYDITCRQSFDHVTDWYAEALESIVCPNPTFVLLGHKQDMQDERRVSELELITAAKSLGINLCFETSAKTMYNIENVFENLASEIYKNLIEGKFKELQAQPGWDGIKKGHVDLLSQRGQPPPEDDGCC